MPIQYIGEHLFPGHLGKAFIWISFFSAIIATVLYFMNSRKNGGESKRMKSLARSMFLIHASTMVGVALVLYYLIFNHYFEYSYVWEYSSKSLPVKYIISCFWAGQEGSFLVWAICQALIGVILVYKAKDWENGVMSVVSLSQIFVTSMMLGVTAFGMKIGGSPFTLIRESFTELEGSIFVMPDYVKVLTDGNGLNPLLENIWMTIHPPILFLGYALALVPFAYAMASLMKREYTSWIKPAIPWTILSLAVLGAGILLGGAWAYVSLTFGGFWSWDPVENSSLVPWMTLVAGLHFLIIARKQHHALLSSYILVGISYVLVLYASFLTRSGVLGDSSAHAFGDNGMTAQLLIYLVTFLVFMVVLIAMNAKRFSDKKKEVLLSREFWMFLGAIIIVISAFQILFTTSIPVVNKIFGSDLAPPSDRVGFYNQWQVPYALLIAAFIAFTQFLNYSENSAGAFFKKMIIPLIISAVLTVPLIISGIVTELNFILMLYFVLFAIVASIYNFILQTAKPKNPAGFVTHLGFALFLLGVLLTFSNSVTISMNTSGYDLGSAKANDESLVLHKNDTLYMNGFYVAYTNKVRKGNTTEYQVDFMKRGERTFEKVFTLNPSVNVHPRMGAVYNPDTRHLLARDYYTYISHVSEEPDYIVINAIMNPYINVLWLGALVMTGGFFFAFWRRMKRSKLSVAEE
jgi:cytochrome c-type biogenesis protein CcmF